MKKAFGLQVPENLKDIVRSSGCALIVYDMQAGIVPQISSGFKIQKQCVLLVNAARKSGLRIFHTRHFFLPSAAAGVAQLRRAMVSEEKKSRRRQSALFRKVPQPFRSCLNLNRVKAKL